MESPLFQSCRQIIANKREEWKKLGMNNHPKVSATNLLNVQNLTIFDRTKPDGLLLEMYVHILKLSQISIAQLLWGEISLIEDQYLVCNQHRIENQTIRYTITFTYDRIKRTKLFFILDFVQLHNNLQHVLFKLIVSTQLIDHHNAIHLNHHSFSYHVQQQHIIFGIKQQQLVKISNKFFKKPFKMPH